jgi:hypothetical protein
MSNVGARFGMALQIPAGHETVVGKERVHAGLRFGRIEDEFGLAILLLNGVVTVYSDFTERIAICRHTVAEHNGVCGETDQRDADRRCKPKHDQSL